MNRRHFYTILLSSSGAAASLGYILGSRQSNGTNDGLANWRSQFPLIRRAQADSSAGTLVLQPSAPSIPTGPIEQQTAGKTARIEATDVEFWKRPSRASEIMRFGYPGFDNLRTFEDFIVSYDRRNRTAHWVMEHLTPTGMAYNEQVDRSKSMFRADPSIHPYFQAQNEDYRRSGYDRGHLAAAANHRRSQLAMDQTFLLCNMSPQVGKGFNRDKWNELEKYVRHYGRKNANVYVCTGPLYLPHQEADGHFYIKYKVIGQSRVAVPTHFFKVLLIETGAGEFELESFLLPNAAIPDEKPLADFLVPLDAIERAAGLLIFDKLPRERLKKVNGKSVGAGGGGGFLRLIGG